MAKPPRGFAKLRCSDPDRLKAMASAAGKRSHAIGHAHAFTPAQAKEARAQQVRRNAAFKEWKRHRIAIGEPCRLDRRCFNTSSCPFDPVCNN